MTEVVLIPIQTKSNQSCSLALGCRALLALGCRALLFIMGGAGEDMEVWQSPSPDAPPT
jgi:hypothetical protein